jgi:hypothetical protein
MPGTKRFICAPGKGQSAKIAEEKLIEIYIRGYAYISHDNILK